MLKGFKGDRINTWFPRVSGQRSTFTMTVHFFFLAFAWEFQMQEEFITYHSGKDEMYNRIVNSLESKENIIIYDTFTYGGPDCRVTASATNQQETQLQGLAFIDDS